MTTLLCVIGSGDDKNNSFRATLMPFSTLALDVLFSMERFTILNPPVSLSSCGRPNLVLKLLMTFGSNETMAVFGEWGYFISDANLGKWGCFMSDANLGEWGYFMIDPNWGEWGCFVSDTSLALWEQKNS